MKISQRSISITVVSIYVITLLCGVGTIVSNEIVDTIRKTLLIVIPLLINLSFIIDQKDNLSIFKEYKGYLIFITLNIFWSIITIIFGIHIGTESIIGLINYVDILVLLFIMSHAELTKDNRNKLVNAFIYSALICSIYGILQYIFKFDLNTFSNDKYPGILGRITGTFYLPTIYDKYAVLVISFAAYFTLKDNNHLYKLLFLLSGINVVLTFSRGGLIALIFVLVIFILASIIKKKWTGMLVPLLLIIIAFLIPGFNYIFQSTINYGFNKLHVPSFLKVNVVDNTGESTQVEDIESDSSLEYRSYYKGVGKEIIKEYPITGIGLNNYSYIYNNQNVTDYLKNKTVVVDGIHYMYPHSGYVQMGAEIGLVGLLIFFAYLLYIGYDYIRNSNDNMKYYVVVLFILFLLGNYTESLIQNKQYMYIFVMLYGLLSNRYTIEKKNKKKKKK